jgi:hypothetical protein
MKPVLLLHPLLLLPRLHLLQQSQPLLLLLLFGLPLELRLYTHDKVLEGLPLAFLEVLKMS